MTTRSRKHGVRSAAGADQPTLLYAVKQVELAIRAQLEQLLKPVGITVAQYTALTVLRRRDGLSTAELARRSFVTAQTMGEMVVILERRGFIVRRDDPTHGRRMLTSLTRAGAELLTSCDGAVADLEERMVNRLNPRQRQAFGGFLNTCRIALAEQSHL